MREAEERRLLREWNQTTRPYPSERCLHELIEAQVERSPDAVALGCGEHRLTYAGMNQRANQLAHYLRTLGVGPETLVGVVADRSAETPIAILAVLKAGGAYVPLDPNYPPARLRFMLADSQIHILLTRRALRDQLPSSNQTVVYVDDQSAFEAFPTTNPEPLATPDHLAYVIYTSGSSGNPKGVLVPHRQIVHSTSARFAFDQGAEPTTFLLLVSFSFDGSCCGLYWTLGRGGQLLIPADDQLQDLGFLRRLIERELVSHLDCAPSLYSMILGDDAGPFKRFCHANLGGEACPPQLAAQHYRLIPNARLINDYGPTEATVWSTRFECHEEHGSAASVPIGRPIPNMQTYVLDEQLNPVLIGTPGELYVAGAGITRGYLNRPDLTAERFVPNPFAKVSGVGYRVSEEVAPNTRYPIPDTRYPIPDTRLYKTGDMARYLPDGNIEFLGRADDQVKIRGYRIELGEIENALLRHPAIAQAAVIVREDSPGHKRLVAYIVSRAEKPLPRRKLIAFLNERLPHYIVPGMFVFLDKLPRSPTGKVDRRALLSLDLPQPASETVFVAPQTPLEKEIAQIAADLLGIERVGLHDNFFELGWDSLMLTRLTTHLLSTYGAELSVDQIFAVPTVAGVARVIDVFQGEGSSGVLTWDMVQLEAETFLDPTITPEWASAGSEPHSPSASIKPERNTQC